MIPSLCHLSQGKIYPQGCITRKGKKPSFHKHCWWGWRDMGWHKQKYIIGFHFDCFINCTETFIDFSFWRPDWMGLTPGWMRLSATWSLKVRIWWSSRSRPHSNHFMILWSWFYDSFPYYSFGQGTPYLVWLSSAVGHQWIGKALGEFPSPPLTFFWQQRLCLPSGSIAVSQGRQSPPSLCLYLPHSCPYLPLHWLWGVAEASMHTVWTSSNHLIMTEKTEVPRSLWLGRCMFSL